MATPKTFKCLGQNDIVIPSYGPDPTGLSSYDIVSDTVDIPVTVPPVGPVPSEDLFDVVRVGLCGIELVTGMCRTHRYMVNNASSRCFVNVLLINGNGIDTLPGDVQFELRQSSGCIPTVRFAGVWSPTANGGNWDAKGFLVQVGGMLSTSWEIRAIVVPTIATPVPHKFSWVLEFIFDRIGDNNQVIKGPNTTGVLLPP